MKRHARLIPESPRSAGQAVNREWNRACDRNRPDSSHDSLPDTAPGTREADAAAAWRAVLTDAKAAAIAEFDGVQVYRLRAPRVR